jgi:4-hydroxy-tetrahydrodipicolinate reductase
MQLVAAFDVTDVGMDVGVEREGEGGEGLNIAVVSPADMETVLMQKKADVLVDFTNAEAAVQNIKVASHGKKKLVVGTTGFTQKQFMEIEDAVRNNVPAVISPNFSIGVNVFWKLIEAAAEYLGGGYHVEIVEMHHSHKRDAPSGTAIKAAKIISNCLSKEKEKTAFIYGRHGITGERTDAEIGIHAVRAGDIVGEHTVLYGGKGERLEITHRAHSRAAFVQGVMKAIEWISGEEKSGIYSMDDVMGWK